MRPYDARQNVHHSGNRASRDGSERARRSDAVHLHFRWWGDRFLFQPPGRVRAGLGYNVGPHHDLHRLPGTAVRWATQVNRSESAPSLLLRGGTILTMNDRFDIVDGDVSIRDGRIAAIAPLIEEPHERVVDASGSYVLPGFIQTHLHLCQTLFRGYADDLPLMDWLASRVWPMEAAHTPATLTAATRLATTELLLSGTTGRVDDGNRARHRCRLRSGGRKRTAGDDR